MFPFAVLFQTKIPLEKQKRLLLFFLLFCILKYFKYFTEGKIKKACGFPGFYWDFSDGLLGLF